MVSPADAGDQSRQEGRDEYAAGMMLLPFLRRLWKRSAKPGIITHTLVCGASRSGKSEAELTRLVPLAQRNDCAIVLIDPPGTLAAKFLLHLDGLGLTNRVLYDRLADTDRVPGYEWLSLSMNSDPLQREAENDESIREFASILLRRRGVHDAARTPLIEEGLLAALRLCLCQKTPCPLSWLTDVFDRHSEARAHLLANCTEPSLVRKFHEYASLSPTARRAETAPVERILRAVLMSPAFRVRSGGATFDLEKFLDEKGILILDGSSTGNLSRDAASVMMGAVILAVIRHCRTGSKSKVVLVLDEAVNSDLIGVNESRALAEAGKWGLEFHILFQDPFSFGSDEIRSNVLQNCWRHEWFRQGSPEAARLAAEDIGIPLLDPLQVHHTEYRSRTTDAGYEKIKAASRSRWVDGGGRTGKSTSHNTLLRPRRKEIREPQDRYTTLTDQILLLQKELMLLKPGYRFVRSDTITPAAEYVVMLQGTWLAAEEQKERAVQVALDGPEAKVQSILEAMKQHPAFQSPIIPNSSAQLPTARRGAARRLAARD